MLSAAVYFPFGHPDEALLKRALLTWDYVEVFSARRPTCKHVQRDFAEAWDFICRPKELSDDERTQFRQRLEDVSPRGFEEDFRYGDFKYPGLEELPDFLPLRKARFSDETTRLLSELGAAPMNAKGEAFIRVKVAKTIIAIEAEIAAGVTKQQITDDYETYSGYCRLIANPRDNQYDFKLNSGENLASIALEAVNLQNISLRKLIDFRKRELKEPSLKMLRQSFAANLTAFVQEISHQKSLTESDWRQIQNDYRENVRHDIAELTTEIHCERSSFLLSKSIFVPIVSGLVTLLPLLAQHADPAVVGTSFLASAGLTETAVAICEVLSEGQKAISGQAKILKSHPLAYMYELADSSK